MLVASTDVSVHPDYYQFYLKTPAAEPQSDKVSGEGYEAHVEATSPGFVYVGTLKQFTATPVRVEVHDAEPGPAEERWQHVAEVSIESDGSGDMLNSPADKPAPSISPPSGPLRLPALCGALHPTLPEP